MAAIRTVLALAILSIAIFTVFAQTSTSKPSPPAAPATKEKPLLLGNDKPLLLLDDEPSTNAVITGGADNSRCQVCHINFMQEKLTLIHSKTNIGCATCHGACDAHIADESWASGGKGTAPDKMFTKSQIRFNCLGCHNWVTLVENDKKKPHLKEIPNHQAVLDGSNREKRFCTDCHGSHRMVTRRCKWK